MERSILFAQAAPNNTTPRLCTRRFSVLSLSLVLPFTEVSVRLRWVRVVDH